jgi:hypothetical protein
MRGRAVLVLAVFVLMLVLPARARAGIDVTQSLIIAGASAGAVAAIYIIAILATGDDEPDDFQLVPGKPALPPAAVWGKRCPPLDGTVPLVCW